MKWPPGFLSAGVSCGIKSGGAPDLGILVADHPVGWSGVFTTNAAAAAPVRWCRASMGAPVRAIVVNSGNANACTGENGVRAVRDTVASAAAALGCSAAEVLVASTGPIGVRLPVERVTGTLGVAVEGLERDVDAFAASILTTDTGPKIAAAEAGGASLVGIAKGAAMIAPNMATMLGFVATDAALAPDALHRILAPVSRRTFGRISIDGCESTNDSVFLLASGHGPVVDEPAFVAALEDVCASLAYEIVRDGEGTTKVVRLVVDGARDDDDAVRLGRAVAASDLWRAAVHGADPNWGRVLAALGAVDRGLDVGALSITIGGIPLFDRGEPVGDLAAAAAEMTADEVRVGVHLGAGSGAAEVLSADLTPDYVKLNAEGTT